MASTSSYADSQMPFLELSEGTYFAICSNKSRRINGLQYHQFGIDVSIVRYFTRYGPSGRPDMSVLRFIKWIDEGNLFYYTEMEHNQETLPT